MTFSLKKTLRIGTRASALAKWQAEYVAEQLKSLGFDTQFVFIKTEGDRIQNRMLHEIGGKGLFVRQIEEELLSGKIDCAVHSLKDLPVQTPNGLELKSFIKRHPWGDLLIVSKKAQLPDSWYKSDYLQQEQIKELEAPLHVGSCSLRRGALMTGLSPYFSMQSLRGNVDTRLGKIASEELDGVILAEAAIYRLSIGKEYHHFRLDPDWFVPSPCQGIIVVQTRQNDPLSEEVIALNCTQTQTAAHIERLVLKQLGADCTLPVGAFARNIDTNKWELRCVIGPHHSLKNETVKSNVYSLAQKSIKKEDDLLALVTEAVSALGVI